MDMATTAPQKQSRQIITSFAFSQVICQSDKYLYKTNGSVKKQPIIPIIMNMVVNGGTE